MTLCHPFGAYGVIDYLKRQEKQITPFDYHIFLPRMGSAFNASAISGSPFVKRMLNRTRKYKTGTEIDYMIILFIKLGL